MNRLSLDNRVAVVWGLALGLTAGPGLAGTAAEARDKLAVRIEFGHRTQQRTVLTPQLLAGTPGMTVQVAGPGRPLAIGAGVVEVVTAQVSWPRPSQPQRKAHSIWQYLLEHGTADQVARLKHDPSLQPDAPVLTVLTAADGTRGFSIGLEQLARHKAMWLPEHDAFVTLADAPVDFEAHLASLKGERVLDRVKRAPESTLAEWTNRWEDIGNPNQWTKPWETSWLGAKGHLTGTVARHGGLYKFGVDRWGNVRPDLGSPHRFRLDLVWPGCRWVGQRIVDGLPIIVTTLERAGQRCTIEQFAAPLRPDRAAEGSAVFDGSERVEGRAPGDIPSVFFTKVRLAGSGPVSFSVRLATENTNRHPELRQVAGRSCVVDRETSAAWLVFEPEAGLTLSARMVEPTPKNPQLEVECAGQLGEGATRELVLKLASPAAPAEAAPRLAALDFAQARLQTAKYWEDWLARGARFDVPEKPVNDLFRANLWHALMLPRFREAGRVDLPYSNFAYGQANADWPINQAVYVDYMIYGLRGYFDVAAEELAAMFGSQQQPDGRIAGYADWGVYSPGMLYAVGQNYLLSRDRAWFDRLLPAALRTIEWCLGQVAKGQTNPAAPGLIVAPLNDLTHEARAWAFPNAYFAAGLDVFGRALEAHGHPQARPALAAAAKLRADIQREFARASVRAPVVPLADGTWNNYVPSDALTPRRLLEQWYPTDVDTGPLHLARLAVIDPRGWLATAMLDDHEDNLFFNQWGMANEPVYNPQATVYLLRDEPEAVIRAFYSMMACAFSHHQLTPLEHRWAWGQYYMPPSTDGAWFELYRHMLLNELHGEGTLFVGQAVPRPWLADGRRIVVANAPTHFGPVTLRMESAAATGRITVEVEFPSERRPDLLLVRLRHPDKKPLRTVTVNGLAWDRFDAGRELIRIPAPKASRFDIIAGYQ